jgi:aspartate kinase
MKVCKFGGTSLADAVQIRKVCDIVLSDPERRLVVVSAPGKRNKADTKVTDLLIALAEKCLKDGAAEKELAAVVTRYTDIARELGLGADMAKTVEADLRARLATDRSDRAEFLDTLKAAGEDNSAKLVAAYLKSTGVDARYVSPKDAGLLLSHEFGNARVLPESYENLRKALGGLTGITIFPGFFGYSPQGAVVTFSRGGSDITGSILAAAVKSDMYENFTDVDSVFVANPTIVDRPQAISELTYREMRELSYAGFSVFHEEALAPVFHAGVPVCIKNTNNPSAPGTRIALDRNCPTGQVAGIAGCGGFCSIYVSKYLMNREVGFGRRLLQILEDEGLSYEHTPSGIDNISVILRESGFTEAVEARVMDRIRKELGAEDISAERGLALVMIVGECMRHAVGLAARACAAFARSSVNIEMINQGSSEVSMMFGVKTDDMDRAVRALYGEFFGHAK